MHKTNSATSSQNVLVSPKVASEIKSKKVSAFVPVSATDLLWSEYLAEVFKPVTCPKYGITRDVS